MHAWHAAKRKVLVRRFSRSPVSFEWAAGSAFAGQPVVAFVAPKLSAGTGCRSAKALHGQRQNSLWAKEARRRSSVDCGLASSELAPEEHGQAVSWSDSASLIRLAVSSIP